MVALTNALERIMNWLKEHQSEYAASFLPGLKLDEIQELEKEFGFKLPEEIYELYQWRNGTDEDAMALVFPSMLFLPLSEAIGISQAWNESILELKEENLIEEDKIYQTSPLFIFLQDNCVYCGIPIIDNFKEQLPVVDFGEGDLPRILYTSLTDMMLTLAECHETGAYYLNEEGYICEDKCKTAPILRKYNAEINERALSTFQSLLLQLLDFSNRDLLEQVADLTIVISRFKDPRGVDLLLEALQNWSKAKGLARDGICRSVIEALGEVCDKRVLQTLTDALQDSSPFVKEEARKALSKLRG